MNNRIEQLDSLRGLASFVVVLNHLPLIAMGLPIIFLKLFRWLGINYGHGSVMLFFVLSGFVLSIPFLDRSSVNYAPYLVKRFFRIYVPYAFAITFALILSQIFWNRSVETVGEWGHMLWTTPTSFKLILEHIYFIGNIHSNAFNGVIWSLIHELRISLIFPFIVLLIKRVSWKVNIFICLMLSTIAAMNNIFSFQVSNGNDITYFHTIHYTAFFIIGSLLAKYKREIVTMYQKSHFGIKTLFLVASFIFFNFSELFVHFLYQITNLQVISTHFFIIMEYGVALGCVGIIISAIGSGRVEKILLLRPFLFLGKVSYSLYLYHLPILLGSIYLLHEVLPLWSISVIATLLSLIVSTIAYQLIEKPCINTGRRLAANMVKKQVRSKHEKEQFVGKLNA